MTVDREKELDLAKKRATKQRLEYEIRNLDSLLLFKKNEVLRTKTEVNRISGEVVRANSNKTKEENQDKKAEQDLDQAKKDLDKLENEFKSKTAALLNRIKNTEREKQREETESRNAAETLESTNRKHDLLKLHLDQVTKEEQELESRLKKLKQELSQYR